MTLEEGFELVRVIAIGATALVSFFGFRGVILNLRQKTEVDNRSEWWKRYVWAEELRKSDSPEDRALALDHLNALVQSNLATRSEAKIVQNLSLRVLEGNNGDRQAGEEGGNGEHKTAEGG